MKTKILLGLGALLVAGALWWSAMQLSAPTQVSETAAQTFARANQLYQNGSYAAAAELYQQLSAQGIENAELYYNLGSAYRALGDAKQANDAYAHAYTLAPRDSEIANAAGISSALPPLTQNETALALLTVTFGLTAAALVLRRRVLQNQTAAL